MEHALRGALSLVYKRQCFGHAQLGASMPNAGVRAIMPEGFCLEISENVSKIESCCPVQRNSLENHLRLSGCVLCVWMCLHLALCNMIKLRLLHPWEEETKKEQMRIKQLSHLVGLTETLFKKEMYVPYL